MKRRINTDDVERVLRERNPDKHPVVTSNYVADETGVSRPTALQRLKDAHDDDIVKTAEIGQASVWWLTDEPITEARAVEWFGSDPDEATGDEGEAVTDGSVATPAAEEVAALRTEFLSKLEELEESVAAAATRTDSTDAAAPEVVGETVDERLEVHEHQQRQNRTSDRAAGGILLGVTLSAVSQFLALPEWTQIVAGVLLLYGLIQTAYYVVLRVRK